MYDPTKCHMQNTQKRLLENLLAFCQEYVLNPSVISVTLEREREVNGVRGIPQYMS